MRILRQVHNFDLKVGQSAQEIVQSEEFTTNGIFADKISDAVNDQFYKLCEQQPRPVFNQNPSSGDRNVNQQQVASGQRDSSGYLWCFTCSGGSFDECTKDSNLKQCSKDQDFCMVELRTQPAQGGALRMVRELNFDSDS